MRHYDFFKNKKTKLHYFKTHRDIGDIGSFIIETRIQWKLKFLSIEFTLV
ncbi:MAG: hypothetical protein RLZZ628_2688 [Bacteroidota bacterium]|jgi:hypothetical protein